MSVRDISQGLKWQNLIKNGFNAKESKMKRVALIWLVIWLFAFTVYRFLGVYGIVQSDYKQRKTIV